MDKYVKIDTAGTTVDVFRVPEGRIYKIKRVIVVNNSSNDANVEIDDSFTTTDGDSVADVAYIAKVKANDMRNDELDSVVFGDVKATANQAPVEIIINYEEVK